MSISGSGFWGADAMATTVLGEELPTRADFQHLTRRRLREAKALIRGRCPEGAVYLAGYAVECALKACIAKEMRKRHFPPPEGFVKSCYIHDLQRLFKTCRLWADFQAAISTINQLNNNWQIVKKWSESNRYDPKSIPIFEAEEFVAAVESSPHGVITWISSRW